MNAHRPPARPAKHGKERGGTAYDTTDIVWGNRHGAAAGQQDAPAHPGGICGPEASSGRGQGAAPAHRRRPVCPPWCSGGRLAWAKRRLRASSPNRTKANFIDFSAVTSGIKEIKEVMQTGRGEPPLRRDRPFCSWTRSTASTKRSRMRFCPLWKREASSSSAPPRKTLRLRSTRRFCPGARCLCCTRLSAEELTELLRRALTDPRGFGEQAGGAGRGHAGDDRQFCQRRRAHGAEYVGDGGAQR